jgi:dihydrofolate synthase / folylpolyglutamate synthase
LETTRALLAALGDPHLRYPTIHVGGTNGKGSVATLTAAALRQAGFRVGLYTSPHLRSFRERITVNGQQVSEEAVAGWVAHLRPLVERTDATFFETTTALAFADFAVRGVDLAVVEVGLGGRLDSTNVVAPLVSAVTHIALDHQRYLGETIEAIAREKAGIAKPCVPFVIGEADRTGAQLLLDAGREAVAAVTSADDYRPTVLPAEARWDGPLALAGAHQRRNAAVAAAVLETLPSAIRPAAHQVAAAFAQTRLAARLDRRGRWLFDVAHNPDGVAALTAALAELEPPRPIHALVSILGDKDWPAMLVELDRAIDCGILTVAPSADTRRWDLGWLRQWLADPARPAPCAEWHLVADFEEALGRAMRGAGTIVVTGSFHTVGDVMAALGMEPGA